MKPVQEWLDEYSLSHQHPVNKIIHWICVPFIVLSLLGLLWVLPFPEISSSVFIINWATLILIAALIYYFILSWQLAIGMLVFFLPLYFILYYLYSIHVDILFFSVVIFIAAWTGQFVGHEIEKKRPSFFWDIQFLLIGPLWLMAKVYKKLKISFQ